MTEKSELKIEFAPGAFDQFDGTQEELDSLVEEIMNMFKGKTVEDIAAMSRPLSDEDLEDLPEDVQSQIMRGLVQDGEPNEEFTRKLQ